MNQQEANIIKNEGINNDGLLYLIENEDTSRKDGLLIYFSVHKIFSYSFLYIIQSQQKARLCVNLSMF